MPVMLFGTIGIFIFSNCSHGAAVTASVSLFGFNSQAYELKFFTLQNSVVDMWNGGIYPLSLLILCFSGIWPYAKLGLMILCWLLPLKFLPYKHRERMLIVLDTMGKYSLIDSYVMVMMIVAFRFKIIPLNSVSAEFDIIVEPNSGIYTFLIATLLSLFWTHIIIHYHRKS